MYSTGNIGIVYFNRVIFTITISIILCACTFNQNQITQTTNKSSYTLEPIIQLGHSDEVTKALFIPNTGYVATASLDGSVKLWESESGREVKTLKGSNTKKLVRYENRRRIQELNITNKIMALAVSPDGKYLISGDIFGQIHIWNITTGKLIKTVKSFWRNHLINSIVFFNDGNKFVTGSEDGMLHVWDFNARSITNRLNPHSLQVNSLAIDPNDRYILSGSSDGILILWDIISNESVILQKESSEIRAVAFSSDGKIGLSGDSDSILTLWDISTGHKIHKFQGPGKVNSVSFSPDNKYFASAHDNSSVIIWNVLTGNVVKSFYLKNGAVNSVQYSPNGDYILGGCTDGTSVMWRVQNSATVRIFQGYNNTPFAISISNDNEFLLSGVNNNALDLWNISEGRLIKTYNWTPNKNLIQLNSHITSVGFSFNKQFVTVLNSNGERINWNILTGEEKDLPINIFSLKFQNADHLTDGRILSSRYGSSSAIIINQHTNSISKLGIHNTGVTAVRFSADGKFAFSGEQAGLIKIWKPHSFGSKGELKGHLDIITSISITNDNRLVGSSSEDNTVRIWDRENQEEVVKLVSSRDGEWIIATPDGYYNTSPEGSNLIHWSSVNNKETYTFEQFESLFKRPDIVRERLSGNLGAGKPAPEITLPPSVEILDNPFIMETKKRTQKLLINASSTRIVKSVRLFINGKPLRTIKIDEQEKVLAIDVPLQSGSNRITVISYDDRGFSSNPKIIDIICNDPKLSKPNLYILGIGVSKYPFLSRRWQLEFADTDAKALIETFEHQKGKYFNQVKSNIITNENATTDNIVAELNALRNISKNDIAIIFMAGHGVMDSNRQFYFLCSEGTFDDPKKGGIDWSMLTSYISEIKGRVIMFIDACHSGGIVTETVVPNDELAQDFFSGKRGGVMVFSASKGRQYSYESPDIGTGAGIFTYAITQGLGPKSKIADTNGNGFVEFMELVDFVTEYVKNGTQGLQTPWLSRRELFGDLSVAVVSN